MKHLWVDNKGDKAVGIGLAFDEGVIQVKLEFPVAPQLGNGRRFTFGLHPVE